MFAVLFVTAASAQTGMIKGKVVDPKGQPVVAAKITIEFTGGINRKMETKTDKKGEFIQIGLQSGAYKHNRDRRQARDARRYPAQVRVGQTAEVNFVLGAGGGTGENPKAAELKKLFEEGVAASRGNQHDVAIEKFNAAALDRRRTATTATTTSATPTCRRKTRSRRKLRGSRPSS